MKSLIVSIILNYLKEKKISNKKYFKGNKNLWTMNMGIPCPLKGMVSVEPSEMVCSVTLLKPWLKFKYNSKIKQTTFLQQAATIK